MHSSGCGYKDGSVKKKLKNVDVWDARINNNNMTLSTENFNIDKNEQDGQKPK